ncbi:hypothetical protein E0Z10_g7860 [Xylaria hypoxylon]|uniref:Exo-alpha-sialidase / neuraminidase n=1 Tax=Xylaria hypoxylon TaxID=37992 RepID=A0A4Z0YLB5_9PEZI|nr:hypothetical protein E0Z10_g7860 [Xylaria hypoxylon]
MTPFVILLLLSISFLPDGTALQVTPGSTCAAFCLDNPESDPLSPGSSNTTPGDITCTDDSFDNSAKGIKFKNCLDCLQKSNVTSDTESDVSWFLYNIRYSVDVCLFGFPNASSEVLSSPCTINWACQPLKKALEAGSLDATRDQFEYCAADGNFSSSNNVDDCIQCFASSPNQGHLSNFMTALKAGCEQKPAPGELIGLSSSLFTGSSVNITTPPSEILSNNKDTGFGITSTGAIVGISLGAGLLFFGGLALFWVYRRRQKRLYTGTFGPHDDPRTGNRSITPPFGSGLSANEKRAISQTSDYDPRTQNSYTNNAEYYSMLGKGIQSNRPHYTVGPNNLRSNPQSVLPTHPAYLPQTHSRQASRESSPPRSIKTNKPDSYALQAYLSAAEDAGGVSLLPPPPPGPPPAAVVGDPSRFRGPLPNQYPSYTRDSSMDSRGPSPDRRPLLKSTLQSTAGTSNPPPLPPPPARAAKVPFIAFPSVSRIRIPKKYTPPTIAVQDATPIDDRFESGSNSKTQHVADISIGLDITNPIVPNEPGLNESQWGRRKQPPPPLVIGKTGADRHELPWPMAED